MSIKKNILKDALVEAREIENFAIASAKKSIEESMSPKIEQAVKDSIKEYETSLLAENSETKEEEIINEEIKIEVDPGSDLKIKLTNDGLEIANDDSSEAEVPEVETSQETNPNQSIEMENSQEDEIFEITNMAEEAPMASEPVADTTVTEPMANPSNSGDLNSKIEDLSKKIDSILAAINPQSAPSGTEGEVQVVDDADTTAPAPETDAAPVPSELPPAAPQNNEQPEENIVAEDDIVFEIEDDIMNGVEDNVMTEDSIDEINLDSIEEIEIIDDEIEEMRGVGNTVLRSAGNRKDFDDKHQHHAPVAHMNESDKTKAQNESKLDELTQENSRLKKVVQEQKAEIKEFKNSFIELREQVQYMQVFNGKLAYANKVLSKGGLSEQEKMKIVESFDKAETIEEAKKIYKNLVTEMENSDPGNLKPIDKLKTSTPNVIQESKNSSTKSDVLFESEERKRMKMLAGVTKIKE